MTSLPRIMIKGYDHWITYSFENGTYNDNPGHPMDIVSAEAPEFNWKEAKAGMCFRDAAHQKLYYIGPNLFNPYMSVFLNVSGDNLVRLSNSFLTRNAIEDVEVTP